MANFDDDDEDRDPALADVYPFTVRPCITNRTTKWLANTSLGDHERALKQGTLGNFLQNFAAKYNIDIVSDSSASCIASYEYITGSPKPGRIAYKYSGNS